MFEDDFEDIDGLNWDDISFDEADGDFDEMDLSSLGLLPEEDAPKKEKKEKEPKPKEAAKEPEEPELEELLAQEEELGLEGPEAEEVLGQMEEPKLEELLGQPEEPEAEPDGMDDLVAGLMGNLDDGGSAGDAGGLAFDDGEDVQDDDYDDSDLLSLIADTDFVPEPVDNIGGGAGGSDSHEDGFSLDSMLSDLGDFEALGEVEPEPGDGLPELSLETDEIPDFATLDATLEPEGNGEALGEAEEKEKVSVFTKIFGNVHDEKARKKEEAAIKAEEEKAKKKEEKEKSKKSKEEIAEEKKQKAQEKKEKQEAAKKIKEAKKQEKEERKRKKKEAKAAAEAQEEVDVGRINPIGATIVFVFFGILAAGIIFGSRSFSYGQSIKKATEHFSLQEYNEAYDEVRGITVKEDDKEIYEKIMTVMYVNKQLNSYHNYYGIKMYPEALDSLLKGLKRYDEYIIYAKDLGVEGDLDYVKGQILGELDEMYQMSEKAAYKIIDVEDQKEYSKKVIEKASAQ